MACSGEFGIWIVPQRNGKELNQFKIYVNPNDTIYKIKQKVAERTKTEEKRFCLFKSDHTELEDDKTVKDCNIRSGDRLKKGIKTDCLSQDTHTHCTLYTMQLLLTKF